MQQAPLPVHRYSRTRGGRVAPPDSALDLGIEEEEDEGDIDEVRRARTDFYSKPPGERRMRDSTENTTGSVRHGSHRKDRRSGGHSSFSKEEREKSESGHRHTHHRRRRKPRRSSESDDGYVYQIPEVNIPASQRPRRESSHSIASGYRTSSAPIPERVRILRTLGLEPPQPSESHRTRRSNSSYQPRRHLSSRTDLGSDLRRDKGRTIVDAPPPKTRPRRSVSLREPPTQSTSQLNLGRSQTTTRRVKRASLPPVIEEPKTSPSKGLGRSTSVFGSIFGPPRPSVPEQNVQCLTCLDDVPISKAPKLVCGHRMCHPCLKRIFTMSVTDPAHMPPKCCTEDCIPLKYVDKLFDLRFKTKWNKKFQEYTTKNRIYCPAKGCGTWIPPKDVKVDHTGGANTGRKYGVCPRCKTQVCTTCNSKRHKSQECPKDESTARFAELAKENGWMRCYNCSATVELKEGCNHMTCRCTAEFCIICGAQWKTCDCPWFNYATIEADRLNHMNVPQVREEIARAGNAAFNAPRAYHEEMERRREQDQRDEEMARQIQRRDIELAQRLNGLGLGLWGAGHAARYLVNEHNVQRPNDHLTNVYNPAHPTHQAATDRVIADLRGRQRVDTNAVGIEIPVPNPVARPPPPPPPPNVMRDAMPMGNPAPPRPPRPRLRHAPFFAAPPAPRRRPVEHPSPIVDIVMDPGHARDEPPPVQEAPRQDARRRSAVLAGLNRGTPMGRVDAWRQHVSGDDGGIEV